MSIWIILLLLIYLFICVLLMGVILVQSGKGGGLSSLGSASSGISDALGATTAERTLNKITTGIAVSFIVLAIILSILGARNAGISGARVLPTQAELQLDQQVQGGLIPADLGATAGDDPAQGDSTDDALIQTQEPDAETQSPDAPTPEVDSAPDSPTTDEPATDPVDQ